MANKNNVKLVLELKVSGISRNQIVTPGICLNIVREKEITYEKVKRLSEEEVYTLIFSDKYAVQNLYK